MKRRPLVRPVRAFAALAAAGMLLALSACLAGGRPDIPFTVLDSRYSAPASRFLDLGPGLVVHYRDQGNPNGPVIVLVHGYSASLEAWEPWVRRLPDFRVITFDLPGHGLTRAPQGYRATVDGFADLVDEVAQRLSAGRYVVGGNSLGGAVAWDLALRRPDHLRGLVLVDAAGWPRRGGTGERPALVALLAGNPVGRAIARDFESRPMVRQGLIAAYNDPNIVTAAVVRRYMDLARGPGHRDILLTIDNRPAHAVDSGTFMAIHLPTLVLHGEADRIVPVADGRQFATGIPGARLITYPGVGHLPMEQIPDQSATDLRQFLQSLAP
jgi:pimeloyl-ACP methyl ester carboxylesterase